MMSAVRFELQKRNCCLEISHAGLDVPAGRSGQLLPGQPHDYVVIRRDRLSFSSHLVARARRLNELSGISRRKFGGRPEGKNPREEEVPAPR
jgi:hypothetical protein